VSDWPRLGPGDSADICLLLEGTYPYVSGGVSSWVHQIIRGLPELSFSIAFLGSERAAYDEVRYERPDNVVHLEKHYMMDGEELPPPRVVRGRHGAFEQIKQLHEYLRQPDGRAAPAAALQSMVELLGRRDGITLSDFLYSKQAWSYVQDHYERFCSEPSFIDYFWTVRNMHQPLFKLSDIADGLPPARLYHSVSTGYAGFLGTLLRRRRQRPFILTEHGIYTKERKIDLAQAEWIQDTRETLGTAIDEEASYIRRLWIHFFEGLGRLAYASASPIVSLYEGNRQRQLADGAAQDRTRVVPNGIDLPRFAALRESRPAGVPPVVGLIGRVVPIKDIKTFIRAMHSVCTQNPQAEGWIVGPEDEDAEYVRECRDLVENLGLTEQVRFLGFRRVDEILPQLGVLVLTSISEALPLVVLEGFAAGVPAVTTDVGSCSELIGGGNEADRAIGAAGELVPIASPEDTARAILRLLDDPAHWEAAQRAGIERVERFYTQTDMLQAYRDIYETALAEGEA
jgi:polysaccharide biosynthesis protein PelF